MNAVRLLESALELRRRALERDHIDTLRLAIHISTIYVDQGKTREGIVPKMCARGKYSNCDWRSNKRPGDLSKLFSSYSLLAAGSAAMVCSSVNNTAHMRDRKQKRYRDLQMPISAPKATCLVFLATSTQLFIRLQRQENIQEP